MTQTKTSKMHNLKLYFKYLDSKRNGSQLNDVNVILMNEITEIFYCFTNFYFTNSEAVFCKMF